MDKHRKAVIELCAAIEIAGNKANEGQAVMIDPNDWRAITKIVEEVKASFNHSMQFRYEQHLRQELQYRGLSKPQGKEAAE